MDKQQKRSCILKRVLKDRTQWGMLTNQQYPVSPWNEHYIHVGWPLNLRWVRIGERDRSREGDRSRGHIGHITPTSLCSRNIRNINGISSRTLTPSSSKVGMLGTLTSGDGATPALPSAATLELPWALTLRTGSSHAGLYRDKFSVSSPKRKPVNR